MNLRAPLKQARGLGSAKHGVMHWWWQRLTGVALVPLILWFVVSLLGMIGADHAAVVNWIQSPVVSLLLILLMISLFHHAQLGVQVVIEDYVHLGWLRVLSLVLVKFVAVTAAIAAIIAILKVSLGL